MKKTSKAAIANALSAARQALSSVDGPNTPNMELLDNLYWLMEILTDNDGQLVIYTGMKEE